MPTPESAADRFLIREGWYFLRWTVDRKMVRGHDRLGMAILGLGTILAPLTAVIDLASGIGVGIGLAAGGLVHLGISSWAAKHPDVRDEPAPALTHRASKMLTALTKRVVGTDPMGQKYYTKFMRQSATGLKSTSKEHLNEVAFAAFERLAAAYNAAFAAALESETPAAIRALQEGMAEGLDAIGALSEFPERAEVPLGRIDRLIEQFSALQAAIDGTASTGGDDVRARLAAWREAFAAESGSAEVGDRSVP